MVHIRQLDPTASPLDYFGYELRRKREEAGLTLKQLGSVLFCSGSLIGQIETTLKVPTREFAERVDAALVTDGMFSRLVGLVLRSQLPTWFQPFADMEAKATYVSTYQCQLVYGLLQTKEYAHAVLATGQPEKLDELLAARMERQRILKRKRPPLTLVVLDEAVLHRPIGGVEVMRDQLLHLLSLRDERWIRLQVLPFRVGEHVSLAGSFTLLRFDDDPDVVYTEDLISGHMTASSETIREAALRYAGLQGAALSVEDSAELIKVVLEERYGQQAGTGQRPLA
ncbi:helix-turn-helix transcriptional regulator [Streptomyces sp. HUAS 31]|uniref:helix-turn-helix domain-containing protein n=1 Tax=Streptomyces sp. HUAS 31 TaxID=3020055 RepID=UPI00230569B2|nr:helix-turn-helix transcriptional regulator [Streptomyces sp. HUAS 31]WCD98206.1 helix-turn-helix transcriptional regulator [Streptomyces sp. HUAS 31]